jgi:hypothetical protein
MSYIGGQVLTQIWLYSILSGVEEGMAVDFFLNQIWSRNYKYERKPCQGGSGTKTVMCFLFKYKEKKKENIFLKYKEMN